LAKAINGKESEMKRWLILGCLVGGVLACSFAVAPVKPGNVSSAYQGQALPVGMNLYLSEDLKNYVWHGHPSTFGGSVHNFSVPLGQAVSEACQETFGSMFRPLTVVGSKTTANGARGVIVPEIGDYAFRVNDMTLVSPGSLESLITLKFSIFDSQGRSVWQENVKGSGSEKLSSLLNPMGEWSEKLPVTTGHAITDALGKISRRMADSQQLKDRVWREAGALAAASPTAEAQASGTSGFLVNVEPKDATVRILNIKPAYSPGMQLAPGRYQLEISRQGYQTLNKWVTVSPGKDLQLDIELASAASAMPAAKPAPPAASTIPQDEVFRKYWAVIVGVSEYSDSRIPSLRYATADAKYFYNWLVSADGGRYAPQNVKLLLDKNATGRNIKDALFNWLRQAIEEDIVLIYFAGHGSPDSPDSPENLYLLPYDTQYDNIAATGFPMWDVETALKRFIKAKRVVVMADACHSGGVGEAFDVARRSTRAIGVNPITTRLEKLSKIGDGVAVISASGEDQTSQEGNQWGGGHGVFTFFLMEGLKGGADYNSDHNVSLGELIPYLSEQVRRATRSAQSPTVAGKFDPALTIARAGAGN
jgi:uncharacterized caspase-like protein